jgi:crotonobetainyl-CoA:carnitine CoA-transferase CaiB-like acyl-CoA transferase
MNQLPLSGLTVVAIEQAVAAPYCTSRLADAGARVVKIERPEGDFARYYDQLASGQSSYFVWLNRGKESRVLDLSAAGGQAALGELIAGADVVVQNLKPGALARLGFAPADLLAERPDLIVCSISGYGDSGPLAQRKAYDLLVQAETGLCSITGGPDEPSRVGISIVDIATGAAAHSAILEALVGRGLHGKGADIRVSMFDVMADWLTVPLLQHEGGQSPKRVGLAHPSIAPYGVYASQDGVRLLVSVQNEREWERFAREVLGMPELLADPRFAGNVERVSHRPILDQTVGMVLSGRASVDVMASLDRSEIAYGVLNDMSGLSSHSQLRRIRVETPGGPVEFPAPGAQVAGEDRKYGAVPCLGEAPRRETTT